ncbi:tumor protein 63-like isoform X2 [Actinia tenebrosa]|nr:tumor protein 63-like isoform X2 [Actinia tenebrosa]XP_031567527.1 tumor protein 63-like isoform X2 [Actinia tenebrosa]
MTRHHQILPKPAVNQIHPTSVLMPSLCSNISPDQDFPGPFDFAINFEIKPEPVPKASPWIFSHEAEKLFAKRNVDIPLRFTLKGPLSPEVAQFLAIRIEIVYSSTEHSRHVVQRCPNHVSNPESLQSGQHIVETANKDAVYGTCHQTGQHVLILPLTKLETGQTDCMFKLEFIRFMCLTTCPGGPERRPFQAVFTLLYKDKVYGRKTLKTKICSTPGRTRDNEVNSVRMSRKLSASDSSGPVPKKKVKIEETPVDTSSNRESKMSVNQAVHETTTEHVGPLHIKQEDEDDELFTIQVRGRETYEYLMKFKEAIELTRMVPPEILESYRASCPPCGPNWHLQEINQRSRTSASQLVTANVQSTSTTTTSSTASTNTRYTLKNVLVRKKKGCPEMKSIEELKEAAK